MANLSNKIKLYANREVDFLKDVILRNDADSNGDYIAEWNLDIAQPTQAQLDALDAQATTYENNQKIIATENSSTEHGTSSLKKFTIMV
jgi:hypothetical protein